MKRLVAVCMVAGLLLATSTAAFATPITGTWTWTTTPPFDNTVSSGFTKTFAGDWSSTIKWFQPYSNAAAPTLPTEAALGFDPAGTLAWGSPVITIDSAKLTIVATGVNAATYPVYRDTTGTNQIGTLIQSPGTFNTGTGTTLITLTGANAWLAPTGFNVMVKAPSNDQDVVVKSSQLQVTSHWDYSYSYEPPLPPPPPVPAPGAILLASMGAGLVSWLRARKAL